MNKKTKKWRKIRLSIKRWKKELKRRRKRKSNSRSNIKRYSHNKKLIQNIAKKKEKVLSADRQFSIRDNPDKTIEFLNKIHDSFLKDMPVFIDVSTVQNMTIDALLYLLALIDNMKYKEISFHVQGNLPKDIEANKIFSQSGFLNYVDTNTTTISTTKDCVQIYDGKNADPEIAKKLCSFAIEKLNKKRVEIKELYNTIMEIIINTKQHAYNNSDLPKWYAYARYDNAGIEFSILDTGSGIPSTVRKNWLEKINELIAKLPIIQTSDGKLLKSVIDGEFRTKTKEKYRGKGIPMIAEQNRNNYIKNLIIVSNNGYVVVGENEKDLRSPLKGTLYYWRIEK